MKTTLITASLFTTLSLAAGCGSPAAQFEGLYQVTSDTTLDGSGGMGSGCGMGTPQPTMNPYTFFSLREDNFLGLPLLGFRECTGNTASTCPASFNLLSSFTLTNGMYENTATSASGGPTSCAGSITSSNITRTADGVQIVTTRRQGTLSNVTTCDTDTVRARSAELSCAGVRTVVARRIGASM